METLEHKETKAFSVKRFFTLLKSDFKINGSHYLKLAFAAVGCFVAVSVLICIAAINDINSFISSNPQLSESLMENVLDTKRNTYGTNLMALCMIIAAILLTVFGSLTFSTLSNKRERISSFMFPASRCEKFTLRALVYFVFGTITIIAGIMLAALIAHLSFKAYSDLSWVSDFLDEDFAWSAVWIMILAVVFGNALYTLGSSLWPRLSWIKTWILLNIVEWVFGILLMVGVFSDQNWAYQIGKYLVDNEILPYVIIVTECILIAACWIGAWMRFRSTQIVQLFMKK